MFPDVLPPLRGSAIHEGGTFREGTAVIIVFKKKRNQKINLDCLLTPVLHPIRHARL